MIRLAFAFVMLASTASADLLREMLDNIGPIQTEGYVSHLEAVATRRMSYVSVDELQLVWGTAATVNRIWFEDIVPIALACDTNF